MGTGRINRPSSWLVGDQELVMRQWGWDEDDADVGWMLTCVTHNGGFGCWLLVTNAVQKLHVRQLRAVIVEFQA